MVGAFWPCDCCNDTAVCDGDKNDQSFSDSNYYLFDMKQGAEPTHTYTSVQYYGDGNLQSPCRQIEATVNHVTGTQSSLYVFHMFNMSGVSVYRTDVWSRAWSVVWSAATKLIDSSAPDGVDDDDAKTRFDVCMDYRGKKYIGRDELGNPDVSGRPRDSNAWNNEQWVVYGDNASRYITDVLPEIGTWLTDPKPGSFLYPDEIPDNFSRAAGGLRPFGGDAKAINQAGTDVTKTDNLSSVFYPAQYPTTKYGWFVEFRIDEDMPSGEYYRKVRIDDVCIGMYQTGNFARFASTKTGQARWSNEEYGQVTFAALNPEDYIYA